MSDAAGPREDAATGWLGTAARVLMIVAVAVSTAAMVLSQRGNDSLGIYATMLWANAWWLNVWWQYRQQIRSGKAAGRLEPVVGFIAVLILLILIRETPHSIRQALR